MLRLLCACPAPGQCRRWERGEGAAPGCSLRFYFFFSFFFSFLFLSSTFLLKHKLYITVFSSGQCCRLSGPQEKILCTWTVASPQASALPACHLASPISRDSVKAGGPAGFLGTAWPLFLPPRTKGTVGVEKALNATHLCCMRGKTEPGWQGGPGRSRSTRVQNPSPLCAGRGDHIGPGGNQELSKEKGLRELPGWSQKPFPPPSGLDPHAASLPPPSRVPP